MGLGSYVSAMTVSYSAIRLAKSAFSVSSFFIERDKFKYQVYWVFIPFTNSE